MAPVPVAGMVIAAGFENVFWPQGVGVGVGERGVPVAVAVAVAVAVGVGLGVTVGVGMGDGDAPPGSALNAPTRRRQVAPLVVGTYSFTCQKVRSSVGSTVVEL